MVGARPAAGARGDRRALRLGVASLACAILAVNAVLVRFGVAAFARAAIPIAALVLLGVAFLEWFRGR